MLRVLQIEQQQLQHQLRPTLMQNAGPGSAGVTSPLPNQAQQQMPTPQLQQHTAPNSQAQQQQQQQQQPMSASKPTTPQAPQKPGTPQSVGGGKGSEPMITQDSVEIKTEIKNESKPLIKSEPMETSGTQQSEGGGVKMEDSKDDIKKEIKEEPGLNNSLDGKGAKKVKEERDNSSDDTSKGDISATEGKDKVPLAKMNKEGGSSTVVKPESPAVSSLSHPPTPGSSKGPRNKKSEYKLFKRVKNWCILLG